ncbi:CREB-regulated transcription coactivator 3 [Puma concolor]|uniref:CREB-regulated transcription coactivator 3 n=1 Tax=Puma concolor TaxID=9696 RepID=A0A6P6HFH0_PUMCO|nr:CREB-regulated transcription coactivator 3 [Puma concolor]
MRGGLDAELGAERLRCGSPAHFSCRHVVFLAIVGVDSATWEEFQEHVLQIGELNSNLTLARVQFQKLQQLRLTQYHGGSLPNVSQLRSSVPEFQPSLHQADSARGTRHHGLVERPARTRFHALHRRSGDKPGRQFDGSTFGSSYSSQPLDESWPRQQHPWKEEKHPGFRLTSALNRTNSDSALHTSALSAKPQDPYGGGGQSAWPAPYMGFCDGENDVHIQSLSGRPRSCDVGSGSAFPHNGQNIGLSPFLGTLNTGGSLPDLTNLHYSAPLPASLDTSDHIFGSMSVGNSVGNLPAAMTHLGIRSSSGLQSSRSNPSIQATLSKTALSSSPNSHPQTPAPSASALHPSLRLFSLSNPSLSTTALSGPSRRRQPPVSPLTLSPGPEAHQGFSRQLSATSPLNPYPAAQVRTDSWPRTLRHAGPGVEDSSTSLFKDLSSALAGMPEASLHTDTPFPLEEELQIEPLSLDGLNMLSDSSMGLLDPSVEETFRADRL